MGPSRSIDTATAKDDVPVLGRPVEVMLSTCVCFVEREDRVSWVPLVWGNVEADAGGESVRLTTPSPSNAMTGYVGKSVSSTSRGRIVSMTESG